MCTCVCSHCDVFASHGLCMCVLCICVLESAQTTAPAKLGGSQHCCSSEMGHQSRKLPRTRHGPPGTGRGGRGKEHDGGSNTAQVWVVGSPHGFPARGLHAKWDSLTHEFSFSLWELKLALAGSENTGDSLLPEHQRTPVSLSLEP